MVKSSSNAVIITRLENRDFRQDYVSLPHNFGKPEYEARPDIQAINHAVAENLHQLDERTHFINNLQNRKVVIKPNLVSVYHQAGFLEDDYPESTDPRVLDAVIRFIKAYTSHIVIVESSGRGMPTRASFITSGIDRLARFHNVELLALEEQPVDRYILPKARVMQEIIIPKIFSEVVRGEAFYISVPKLKTNLYTGVTLGFKNAMGTLSYNLRQRNHTFQIDQKLVDMLFLFQPDLVIIDGIVGGEGNCPAPVQPVDARIIISGTNSVETDRVATRIMGFDPDTITLTRLADAMGFGDPRVQVIGDTTPVPFQPADPSLQGEWMTHNFPNVRVLAGFSQAPARAGQTDEPVVTVSCAMEMACRGGCLATIRFGFDMLYHEGKRRDFPLVLIFGPGIQKNGKTYYRDKDGKAWSLEEIAALKEKKLALGSCTKALKGMVDKQVEGCMPFPNSPHMALHQMSGTWCAVMSLRNHFLLPSLLATLQMCEARKRILRSGQRIDCDLPDSPHLIKTRPLTPTEMQQDFIKWDFPPLTRSEIRTLCALENRNILSTFLT